MVDGEGEFSEMSSQTRTLPPIIHATVREWMPVLLGLMVLYVPTYVYLARTLWGSDEQGHGPIILALALWFIWQKRQILHDLPIRRAPGGWLIFIFGLLAYFVGNAYDIFLLTVGSQIPVLAGILLIMRGYSALRLLWFPLLFLAFMVPLPSFVVQTLTLPMKIGVSWATEHLLYAMDYPVARTGVILQIGQYKLQVADACAGLNTLFTLESMGLLYLHLVRHESVVRNTVLALLIIPISFSANTIRVVALTLITYYFGDEAGQGFLHGFAGMVLFVTALLLIMSVDWLLQRYFPAPQVELKA
jgi:exosortase B